MDGRVGAALQGVFGAMACSRSMQMTIRWQSDGNQMVIRWQSPARHATARCNEVIERYSGGNERQPSGNQEALRRQPVATTCNRSRSARAFSADM